MILRSALFNVAFWVWIFILGMAGLPVCLVYRPFAFTVSRIWAAGTLWLLRVLCHVTYEVRGKQNIPKGAALIASKHQSAWDTVIFWTLLQNPSYVLKRELIFIPVFGWYLLLLKCIYIDRKSGASAMKRMLRESRARTDEGRSVIIFPEGTRMAAGVSGTYHPGVAALYQHLNLAVTPVALNSGLHWGKNSFIKTPGLITIEFLPPIPPGLKSREFLPLLKERVEAASRALLTRSGE